MIRGLAPLLGGLLMACGSRWVGQASAAEPKATFWVAPDGDDAQPGTREKPFATLARARDAVREMKRAQGGTLKEPVSVALRGGTYVLAEPLVLTPEDSGTKECPVRFMAFQGETPVLSGGRIVSGWEPKEAGVWEAALPEVRDGKWVFRQLFVAEKGTGVFSAPETADGPGAAQRKRLLSPFPSPFSRRYRPTKGAFVIAGLTDAPAKKAGGAHARSQDEFRFFPGDIQEWANLGDVEIVALHDWSASRLRIREIDAKEHVVRFTGFPIYRIGHWYKGGRNPYYAENVKEAGLKPGEWYLDRPTGTLSYRPLPGEEMDKLLFVGPRVQTLARLAGDPAKGQFVEHVAFESIAFCHTDWVLPPQGYGSRQGMIDLPAAVEAQGARACRLERCTFAHLGAYAVKLGAGCSDNEAVGCRMFDLAGGGVMIGVTDTKAQPPVLPTGNTVANCVISDGGLEHFSAHGLWVGIAARTRLAHNVVRRFPYSAIAIGWSWNANPTSCRETVVEFNHIHDAMMLLADGGGIYSLGLQPGTVLRGNHIHDIHRSPFAGSAPNNGMFLDEGSKEFLLEGNVIYRTAQQPVRFNRSKQDLHAWRDNSFGLPPDDPKFPEYAKTTIAQAGLEPAFRDLDLGLRAAPPPIYAMKLPPPPPEPAPGAAKAPSK